jgi:hypothetical protein
MRRLSLLARVLLAMLCLLGGCGISGFVSVGLTVVAATGAYPAYSRDVALWSIPAVLGVVAAVAILWPRGERGGPPAPPPGRGPRDREAR